MKKISVVFLLFLSVWLCTAGVYSQSVQLDSVPVYPGVSGDSAWPVRYFDRFGNYRRVEDLQKKEHGSLFVQQAFPGDSVCMAGYFELTFHNASTGQGFYDPALGAQRRGVICAVFRDLAELIVPQGNPVVRIHVFDFVNASSGVAAFATPIYNDIPVASALTGMLDDAVWKTINTGVDAWAGFSPRPDFHAELTVNFGINYHLSTTTPCPGGVFDLYSVVLHEALHDAGIVSLVDFDNGVYHSLYSPGAGGYYSRFDGFLRATGSALPLAPNADGCYLTALDTTLTGHLTTPCTMEFSGPVTASGPLPLFTPSAPFQLGSHASHFDTTCYPAAPRPDLVMHPGLSLCELRRMPDPEEARVLCDMGYRISGHYGFVTGGGPYRTYTPCTPLIPAGVNDSLGTALSGQPFTLPFAAINGNDVNANEVSCVEVLGGAATGTVDKLFMLAGDSIVFIPDALFAGEVAILRYIPRDNSNNIPGNITYIFIRVNSPLPPASCDSINVCNPDTNNLVVNGGFEMGNTGFSSQYQDWGMPTGTFSDNHYAITGNPQSHLTSWCGAPHGGAQFLICGLSVQALMIWMDTVPVVPHTNYIFSCWLDNIVCHSNYDDTHIDPDITLRINGEDLGIIRHIPEIPDQWVQACVSWNSGDDTTAALAIYSPAFPSGTGRDVGIDDIAFYRNSSIASPVVSSSVTLCTGSCATLTASGSGTLHWSTGDTTASVSVCPQTTTTYSVTRTDSGCTSPPALVTVTVTPAPVAEAGPGKVLCSDSVSIGGYPATGGTPPYTYNWSPAAGLSCTGCYNPLARPSATTTYTLTVTDATGCSGTDTVAVTMLAGQCCSGTVVFTNDSSAWNSQIPPGGTLSSVTVAVNGTFTVNSSLTLNACTVRLAAGARIVVRAPYTLTLQNVTRLYACGAMWDGIYLEPGARLVSNGTSIEDALNAVVSQQCAEYDITYTTFNKCYKGLVVDPCAAAQHPGRVSNTKFTCTSTVTSPGSTLKTPHAGELPAKGVEINGVKKIYIGQPPAGLFDVPNLFDNLQTGIYALNSSLVVRHNRFQNIVRPPLACGLQPCTIGNAIHAETTNLNPGDTATWYSLTVGGDSAQHTYNTFQNCYHGVYSQGMAWDTVTRNTFKNIKFRAVFVYTPHGWWTEVDRNKITNATMGIHVLKDTRSSLASGPHIHHNRIENDNTFLQPPFNTPLATVSGIQVEYLLADVSQEVFPPAIHHNEVSHAAFGIRVRHTENATQVYENLVRITPAASGGKTGIRAEGTGSVQVYNNIIDGSLTTNTGLRGLYATLTPGLYACNTADSTGQGLVFEGFMPARVEGNLINAAADGLVLRNSGTIGPQGSAGYPSDNRWTGSFANSHTLTLNSDGDSSTLWVRNVVTYVPTINMSNVSLPIKPQFTNGPYVSCPVPEPFLSVQFAEQVAENHIIFPVNIQESRWLSRQWLHRELRRDPALRQSSEVLQHFYDSARVAGVGIIDSVKQLMAAGAYTQASFVNNQFVPVNEIEQNHKTVNGLYLDVHSAGGVYTTQQINTLHAVAQQCPLTGGNAVYQARIMLGIATDSIADYTDACALSGKKAPDAGGGDAAQQRFSLYPNPGAGVVQLEYALEDRDEGELIMYDISGREVSRHPLPAGQRLLSICTQALEEGVYLYRVTVNRATVFPGRLVIIR